MKKRNRFIIVLVCVVGFFVISPVLVFYSMGYRFDFEKMIITATGGIYVRSFPAPEQVVIDSKITQKPGLFSNWVFVQSLIPNEHAVLVQKTDHYDYFKTILVEEKEVTKLENIILFKKDILFEPADPTQSPFNVKKITSPIKKSVAFAEQNGNIIWLGTDGFLYKSSASDILAEPTKLTLTQIEMSDEGVYQVTADNKNIFVNNDGNLLFLNPKTNELEYIYSPIKDIKISPNGESIVFHGDKNIYTALVSNVLNIKNGLLYKSPEKINNFLWLNDYYIVFTAGYKIIVSETDYRGNVNAVTLSPKINLEKPEIYFDQQENKLYISTGDILLLSEKLIP